MRRQWLLWVGVVLVMLGLVLAATAARAGDIRTTDLGPSVCRPVYCWQHKQVTTHIHGQRTVTVTYLRHRPVESRSAWTTPAWTSWRILSAVVTPVS
jgi:hypothetical protein